LFYVGCGSIPTTEAGIPVIAQIVPQTITTGTSDATVEVVGSNFTNQTVVLWNGGEVATTVVNNTTLAGTVAASNLTVPGTAVLQLQNNITGQRSAPMPIKITSPVAATPLTMTTTSLPSAAVGAPYSVTLAATGGTPSYTWRLTSGRMPNGLALSSSTGILSGTPTVAGSYSLGITVTDRSNPTQEKLAALTLVVAAANSLNITTTSLPSTTVGASYSQTLLASGGTPSYSWSITSGSLPAGLTLASTGTISGTPTVGGTFSLNAAVVDDSTPVQTRTITLTITVAVATIPLKITTSGLAAGTTGAAYSQSLSASGGTPAYSWTLGSGSLPKGLTLTSAGAISGTPTASGTFSFTATLRDSGNPVQTQSVTLSIAIAAVPLKISTSALASGAIGSAYSQSLSASGGTPGYTWSLASGSLPTGLTLTSTGAISGTPTAAGTSSFTATVRDSGNPVQTQSVTLSIAIAATPLKITASALAQATGGRSYMQSLQATGGTPGYTWTITSGSLPAGLTLATTGAITGTPTASGTSTFTALVSDSGNPVQTVAAALTISVAPAPITITASAMATATAGSAYSQALHATGGTAPYTWSIKSGKLPTGLSLSSSTGVISGAPTTSGTVNFTAMVMDSSSPAQGASLAMTIGVVASQVAPVTPPIQPAKLTIAGSSLLSSLIGAVYSQTLSASGGTAPYSWAITSGQLPAGLALSASTGAITGTASASDASGGYSFAVTVTDSSNPAQTASASTSITLSATPLSITSSGLAAGTDGTAYSQTLRAAGGTPAYTWSISSGSLPAGLTLAGTAGTISGTPTGNGTSSFTATVTDNGIPAQVQSVATSITVTAQQAAGSGATWYVRPDGGTRYSSNAPKGQCNGKADSSYPGTGVNQNCAFNDFRYMWDDDSGVVSGQGTWIGSAGDTVYIFGCTALPTQQNAVNPTCRIGWDINSGGGAANNWCPDLGPYSCTNPALPANTHIYGGCVLAGNCNTGNTTVRANLTQIFGGFGLTWTLNLAGAQGFDMEGIELTTHNGACTHHGSPQYPRACSTSQPLDDYADNGVLTNNTSSGKFQDVYIDGFESSGLSGPIGGAITMTRVNVNFNAFAGWNFDDGSDTPDAAGSSITASFVTMEGNGCKQQYPITDAAWPAAACWDPNSGGFGDSWSGQDTELDSFSCDHCAQMYNTKDGFIGPHTQIKALTVTNSVSIGNMGAQWKWGQAPNGTILFQNNLTVTNCYRQTSALPGAVQNFNSSTGLVGSYLSDFCRGGAAGFANLQRSGSVNNFYGNTVVAAGNIIFQLQCGYYTTGNVFNQETNCGSVPNTFKDNNFLGYTDPSVGQPSALYYAEDSYTFFTGSYNDEFGMKSGAGDACGTSGNICVDPKLVSEPAQSWPGSEAALDVFNPFVSNNSFYPMSSSPLIGAGTAISGLTADFYGLAQTSSPTLGGVQP